MMPARQGDFDGLCGLYALINALDLAVGKRPRAPIHRRVFVALATAIPAKDLRRAIDDGLDGGALVKAAAQAFPAYKRHFCGSISVTRPFRKVAFDTDQAFLDAIADIMASGRSALVLNVSTPAYSHWTVAASITTHSIALRDSGVMKELPLARYTVKRGRYRIRAKETLLVHFRPHRTFRH